MGKYLPGIYDRLEGILKNLKEFDLLLVSFFPFFFSCSLLFLFLFSFFFFFVEILLFELPSWGIYGFTCDTREGFSKGWLEKSWHTFGAVWRYESVLDRALLMEPVRGRYLSSFDEISVPPRNFALHLLLPQEPHDRRSIHVRRDGYAGDIQERGRQVNISHHALDDPAVTDARTPHHERHSNIRFKWERFAYHSFICSEKTIEEFKLSGYV